MRKFVREIAGLVAGPQQQYPPGQYPANGGQYGMPGQTGQAQYGGSITAATMAGSTGPAGGGGNISAALFQAGNMQALQQQHQMQQQAAYHQMASQFGHYTNGYMLSPQPTQATFGADAAGLGAQYGGQVAAVQTQGFPHAHQLQQQQLQEQQLQEHHLQLQQQQHQQYQQQLHQHQLQQHQQQQQQLQLQLQQQQQQQYQHYEYLTPEQQQQQQQQQQMLAAGALAQPFGPVDPASQVQQQTVAYPAPGQEPSATQQGPLPNSPPPAYEPPQQADPNAPAPAQDPSRLGNPAATNPNRYSFVTEPSSLEPEAQLGRPNLTLNTHHSESGPDSAAGSAMTGSAMTGSAMTGSAMTGSAMTGSAATRSAMSGSASQSAVDSSMTPNSMPATGSSSSLHSSGSALAPSGGSAPAAAAAAHDSAAASRLPGLHGQQLAQQPVSMLGQFLQQIPAGPPSPDGPDQASVVERFQMQFQSKPGSDPSPVSSGPSPLDERRLPVEMDPRSAPEVVMPYLNGRFAGFNVGPADGMAGHSPISPVSPSRNRVGKSKPPAIFVPPPSFVAGPTTTSSHETHTAGYMPYSARPTQTMFTPTHPSTQASGSPRPYHSPAMQQRGSIGTTGSVGTPPFSVSPVATQQVQMHPSMSGVGQKSALPGLAKFPYPNAGQRQPPPSAPPTMTAHQLPPGNLKYVSYSPSHTDTFGPYSLSMDGVVANQR